MIALCNRYCADWPNCDCGTPDETGGTPAVTEISPLHDSRNPNYGRIGGLSKSFETTPTVRHPLNDFADRWEVDGDCIRCRGCNRPQQASWMHHDFPHVAGCRYSDAERNPWKTLASLITAQSAKAEVA
jgi:hypothetical protein